MTDSTLTFVTEEDKDLSIEVSDNYNKVSRELFIGISDESENAPNGRGGTNSVSLALNEVEARLVCEYISNWLNNSEVRNSYVL